MSGSDGMHHVGAEQISRLIGEVYECVLRPEHWATALAGLSELLAAKAASIHVIDPVQGRASLFAEHGTNPSWTALLVSRYAGMSPIGAAVLLADVEQPVGAFDFIDEAEFVESRFYKEWCAPQGYHDMLGALIAKRPREIGAVSVTRLVDQPRFGESERWLLGLIAPHVRRAVTISGLLEHRSVAHGALLTIIDQLSTAVVIVDGRAGIIRANRAAEDVMQLLSNVTGKLSFADVTADRLFRTAIQNPAAEPTMVPVDTPHGERRVAVLLPVDREAGLFALFLHTPEPEAPASARHLMQAFGLTPREVAVLFPLLEGKSVADIADSLGVSVATIRTHVQRLLDKTGTTRQAELVGKIMQVMPPVRLN